jgi:hypothetical protein
MVSQLRGMIMKNEFLEAWGFLMKHKVFNVETIVRKSDLPILSDDDGENCDEILSIRHSYFERCLSIMVVKLDPNTNEINLDDNLLNTDVRVWLEVSNPVLDIDGDWGKKGEIILARSIEKDLSSSGDTFEDAILNLVDIVKLEYGSDIRSSMITLGDMT